MIDQIRARIEGHMAGRKAWGKEYGVIGKNIEAQKLLDDLIWLDDNGYLEMEKGSANELKAEKTKLARQLAAAKAQNAKLTKANKKLRDSLDAE